MPHHHSFQDSFWSPNSSIEEVPNFNYGFDVLHSKLSQSKIENTTILDYVKVRIEAERAHAATLLAIPTPAYVQQEIETGLKKCFDHVRLESEISAKQHLDRAEDLSTTVLDPLKNFFARYDRILTQSKSVVEQQINQFHRGIKNMDAAKSNYITKCKALFIMEPDLNLNFQTIYTVGHAFQFVTRDQILCWFNTVVLQNTPLTKLEILNIIQQQSMFKQELDNENDEEAKRKELELMFRDLVRLEVIRQEDEDQWVKLDQTVQRKSSGFFRWNYQKKDDLLKDMLDADRCYRLAVRKVEKLRIQTEEILSSHYEEMESLELERIQTIKQAFICVAASLSNTIPRCKETFDNMMLYQETLKPDKEVQSIVEQYRTGQFCPKPILYQNYFQGYSKDQLFGIPLEEITKIQGSLVPSFISVGLPIIEAGFSNLYEEEKELIWEKKLPLETLYKAREEISHSITKERLEKYDTLLLTSLIRLYFLELPECLFTFEFYDPCKLIYSTQNQDKNCRLTSISKLLATLPTANYHTITALLGHFHRLVTNNHITIKSISKSFSYILLRPQIESKLSIHERHAEKLLYDLIENYQTIFTTDLFQLQEKNSNRPHMIVPPPKQEEVIPQRKKSVDSVRSSTSSSLRSFMKYSQSTPTTSSASSNSIRMPSSTLFEDPDESLEPSSTLLFVSPVFISPNSKHEDGFMVEDLATLDSFFEDED